MYHTHTNAGHITCARNISSVLLLLLCITTTINSAVAYTIDYEADYSSQADAQNTYDYVIVGVGQAGSVVAGRLAQNYSVFGIEAGLPSQRILNGTDYVAASMYYDSNGKLQIGTPFTRFDVPAYFTTVYTPPTPYDEWQAYFNGVLQTAYVGKYLGGSGAHNGMIFVRFTAATINSWNLTGWSYNETLPYYKRSENCTGSVTAAYPQYHGLDGPIQVSDTPTSEFYSSVPIWLQACNNSGFPRNPDINGASRFGCGLQVYNIRRGVRDSAAAAYLPQALAKGNLTLSLNSIVTRVLIRRLPSVSSATRGKLVAYGVEYMLNNVTLKRVFARKEVIITASAINTPKILMLSGIGPNATLQKYGIKVWLDNPNVGVGLSANQISFGAFLFPAANYPNGLKISAAATQYAINGTGPWASTGAFAYLYACSHNKTTPSNDSTPDLTCDDPDIMISTAVGGSLASQASSSNTISTQISTCKPQVRGIVTIQSADYNVPPNITMNDFGNQADLNSMIYGFRLLRKIFATYPANNSFGAEITPGPLYQTDANFTSYILSTSWGARFHYVGTARMGNAGSTTAVCDTQMKVVGIDNLRVCDTSTLLSLNSHTSASAVLAGERCAGFILGN